MPSGSDKVGVAVVGVHTGASATYDFADPENSMAIPTTIRSIGAVVVLALLAAWAHRSWQNDDPCTRSSRERLLTNAELEALSYRHDQQRAALGAAHDLALANALLNAKPADRIAITANRSQVRTERLSELAGRQQSEFDAACRRLVRKERAGV